MASADISCNFVLHTIRQFDVLKLFLVGICRLQVEIKELGNVEEKLLRARTRSEIGTLGSSKGNSGTGTRSVAFPFPLSSRKGLAPSSLIGAERAVLLGLSPNIEVEPEESDVDISLAFLFPRLVSEDVAESGGLSELAGCVACYRKSR